MQGAESRVRVAYFVACGPGSPSEKPDIGEVRRNRTSQAVARTCSLLPGRPAPILVHCMTTPVAILELAL